MRTLTGMLLQQVAVGTFQCLLCFEQVHGDMGVHQLQQAWRQQYLT